MIPHTITWVRSQADGLSVRLRRRPGLSRVAANVAWLGADKIVRLGVGLLVGIWVARYLGPQDYGLLNFAIAFVSVFAAFTTLGLPSIVVRDLVQQPRRSPETLGTAFVLHLAGGLASFCAMIVLIAVLRPDDQLARAAVSIIGISLLAKSADVARYWFEARVQSKYVVWAENGVYLVSAAVKIGLIQLGAPLMAFVWVALFEAVIAAAVLLLVYFRIAADERPHRVSLARVRELLRDSWPLAMSVLAIALYMRIDQIMIGQLLDDTAVGIYSVAVRVSEIWYFVPIAIVASTFPSLIAAKQSSSELYAARWQRLYDLMTLLGLGVALPMTFLSGPLITSLYGTAYAQAGPVLAVHVWASVFVFLGVASGNWFILENRQMWSLQRTFAGAIANIALNTALIPRFGVLGAAYATVVSQGVAALGYDLCQGGTRRMFAMKLRTLNIARALRNVW